MAYVVFGAGAIGAAVGGRLALSGRDVILIARGPHLEAMQAHGLRLESPDGTETVHVPAVGHPREIDWHANHVVLHKDRAFLGCWECGGRQREHQKTHPAFREDCPTCVMVTWRQKKF